jgi:hypothetical protein
MKYLFLISTIILFLLLSCEDVNVQTEYSGKGTIKSGTDTFFISADDSRNFLPKNLSDEYKINELRVEFRGNIEKNDQGPPNMEVIELTYIKKI